MLLKNVWHGRLHAITQKWTDMHHAITSANNFSGKSVVISRISPVQLAGSVRKPTLNRPFICPILGICLYNIFTTFVVYFCVSHYLSLLVISAV